MKISENMSNQLSVEKVKTAVFPVAGFGTRFLPITKAIPKEMLPIIDKPLIQYAVEEAIEAGIERLIFVTSSSKHAIEDYFDSNFELNARLQLKGKLKQLDIVNNIIPPGVSFSYIRQSEPKGLGHAVLAARDVVGDEPFAVLLSDDLMVSNTAVGLLKQMVNAYEKNATNLVAVDHVAVEEVHKYGIVAFDENHKIHQMVEKPAIDQAPSQWAVVARYILNPEIFSVLENTPSGVGNELQLTDAIATLLSSQGVHAHCFHGKRFDCGSPEGYIHAIIDHALKHNQLSEKILQQLSRHFDPQLLETEG